MHIPDKEDFQPSSETIRKWLATRKPDIIVSGIKMPGFFNDAGNSSDSTWFWIAIIGELVGLFVTIYGGAKSGGIFMILAIVAVIVFIFLDVFFAKQLHRNESKRCELRTRMLLTDDDNKSTIQQLYIDINNGKTLDFVYTAAIVVIAILKLIGILLLGAFNELIFYVLFAFIYFIVAYIHIKFTGYFLAYKSTESAIKKEYKDFAFGKYKAQTPDMPYQTNIQLRKVPIKHNPHEIIDDGHDNNFYKYIIKTKGLLTDSDIISLMSGQDDNNKITLFKTCRKLQLENIEIQNKL